MLEYADIMKSLTDVGMNCSLIPKLGVDPARFPEVNEIADEVFRLEVSAGKLPPWPGDRSFWIRRNGPDAWTIGLWSGREYSHSGDKIVAICLGMLSATESNESGTPTFIPPHIMIKYGILPRAGIVGETGRSRP